ncbi:MAG: hypothetical protein WA783_11640 [Phormidesmis sp.]
MRLDINYGFCDYFCDYFGDRTAQKFKVDVGSEVSIGCDLDY